MTGSLFHLLFRPDWPDAGEYRPAAFEREGFVHCSYAGQVLATVQRHYRGVANLVVVELDPARLPPVRVENGFPHVYGPIPITAAIAVREQSDPLFTTGSDHAAADH